MNNSKKYFSAKILAEIALFVSLATVLSYIKLFSLPQSGSVTAGSMVPIIWLALRRGPKVGLFAAVLYGVVQFAVDPYFVHPVQMVLDYPLAFGLLGVAGFFQKRPYVGAVLGIFGRFVCHFLSGIIFFAMYAPEGMNVALYSAMYNGGYLAVELAITIYIVYMLRETKTLDIYK
ncbi:MAG: energy-coupled thiamine transporter ThiT [Candidatus Bathyarchaeota archaeon]|nr:energy-coupled thiamine transporter ThiT [Candidatus Bathyarchaeota archaeon]